jgi:uncharacterized membrane protein YeaQ/YmgE (transglycosylase-associated protein family)
VAAATREGSDRTRAAVLVPAGPPEAIVAPRALAGWPPFGRSGPVRFVGGDAVNFIVWLIFGALAGWVASMLAGTNSRMGWPMNIVVGILGAFLGGFIFSLLTGADFNAGFNIGSFIVAVVGALILLAIIRMVDSRA